MGPAQPQSRRYSSNNFDRDHKLTKYPLKQWCFYTVSIEETEWLTWPVLSLCVKEFFTNVLNTLTDSQYLQVTIKIKYLENIDSYEEKVTYKSLTGLESIGNNLLSRAKFTEKVKAILDLKSNYYVSTNVERVTFVFRIFKQEPEAPVTLPILDTRPEIEEKKKKEKI